MAKKVKSEYELSLEISCTLKRNSPAKLPELQARGQAVVWGSRASRAAFRGVLWG
jgi:hypothetical protein